MKVIVLTDTHGQIDRINQLAVEYNADVCIHCGDIGFFDHISIKNMSAAELTKMIRRAPVTKETIEHVCSLPQRVQADFVLQNALAGNFEDYLAGRKTFEIPVYAVWGNHEDLRIINHLREKPLHNLTLLDEKNSVLLEKVRFYGLGGDFNEKHLPIARKLGIPCVKNQIKSAFWQYHELIKMLDKHSADEVRIQVTHCDPCETAFLEALAYRGKAALTLSGHMHRQENQFSHSCGSSDAVFRNFAEKYPSLPWAKMQTDSSETFVDHINLAPSKPLILEINGAEYHINNIKGNISC